MTFSDSHRAEVQIQEEDREVLQKLPIPATTQAWLTRGYLRASLLDDLQPQDDLDVVVALSQSELEACAGCIADRRTMHGGFSFYGLGPRSVDVFCIAPGAESGRRNLEEALASYEFSCDAIALNIRDGSITVCDGYLSALENRSFDVQPAYYAVNPHNDFLVTKGIYLMLRHRLKPGPILESLLDGPPPAVSERSSRVASMFGSELVGMGRTSDLRSIVRRYPNLRHRLELMFPCLQIS
jgi:hypothetical protein